MMKTSLLTVVVVGCAVASAAPKEDPPRAATRIVSQDPGVDAKVDGDGSIVATLKSAPTLFSEPCRSPYHLQTQDGGKWTDVTVDLPAKGNYWLDGEHHGYGMCDYSP